MLIISNNGLEAAVRRHVGVQPMHRRSLLKRDSNTAVLPFSQNTSG